MKKKNIMVMFLAVVFIMLSFASCAKDGGEPEPEEKNNMEEENKKEDSSYNILDKYNINI